MQNEGDFPAQLAELLQLAASCSCIYQQDESGFWRISPQASGATWSLQQSHENRWLLIVKEQPQINLTVAEVFTFLNRQRQSKL